MYFFIYIKKKDTKTFVEEQQLNLLYNIDALIFAGKNTRMDVF